MVLLLFGVTFVVFFMMYLAPGDVTAMLAANAPSAQQVVALRHLVLPAVTLASFLVAYDVRMVRACMLEVLRQDYVRTARAKGLREAVVVGRHALRNALVPVVTVVGVQVGLLIGGSVITETVFAYPGVGQLVVSAIAARDTPLVQGCVLVTASGFILVNLLVDVSYVLIDPRIRLS